jgi:hypothetical protein
MAMKPMFPVIYHDTETVGDAIPWLRNAPPGQPGFCGVIYEYFCFFGIFQPKS